MAESALRDHSKAFAKEIVILCRKVKETKHESVLTNQLLRAGTSIGANIHEAQYAQSKNDFISKLQIALKECYETEYWIEIFVKSDILGREAARELYTLCGTIRRMLISSINTAKEPKA